MSHTARHAVGMLGLLLFLFALAMVVGGGSGCASVMRQIDDANEPADDDALKRCRKDMRSARDAGADAKAAWDVYYGCTVDAGLR